MQMKLFPGPVIAWYPQGPSTSSYDLFLFFLTVELLVAKGIYQGAGREFNLYSAMRLSHLWGEAEEGPSREEEEEAEEAERISICCCKCCWIC